MNKRDILDTYMGLKDDGLTHQEIEDAFLDPENTGGAPIDINQELKQLKSLKPDQMQEMTDDAFTESDIDVGRKVWDVSQQALQGMSFGFADEIEARLRATAKGTDYEDEIEDVRAEIESFRKENPGMAFTAEMAGAFLIPGFATTKLIQMAPKLGQFEKGKKLYNAMKRAIVGGGAGAVEGGLYGAGVAEEGGRMEGAQEGAFWGSVMGAGLGPTLGWFTDAIAGKLSSKVGQKGDEMVDVDGNVVIEPSKPSTQKEAQDLMIQAAQIDDVKGLKKLQETLNHYIEIMPDALKKMTFSNLFEEGGYGQGLAELLAKLPGKGMKASRQVYDEISGSLPKHAGNLIKKTIGPRVLNPKVFKDFLWNRASKRARPFYDKADPELVDAPQLVSRVKQMMGIRREGMDKTSELLWKSFDDTVVDLPRNLKEKGIDAPNFGKSGPYNKATILHWDTFIKKIDGEIKELRKVGGNEQHIGRLEKTRKDIRDTLGDLNEDYNKATGIHSSKHAYNEAFESGLNAHKDKSITPEFMLQQVKKLGGRKDGASTPEESMYRLGYAWGMYQKIMPKSVKTSKDPAAWLDLFSEDQPEKIRALFKDVKIADTFLEQIHILSKASSAANKFRYGSATAPLQFMKEQIDLMAEPGLIKQTISAIKDWGGTGSGEVAAKARTDALTAMATKQGPEEMQRILNDLNARALEKTGRGSGTMGAGYPAGATGAMTPLSSGEDRQWMPGYDEEEKRIRRGILSGPMDLPSKMFGGMPSLLY